MSPSRPDLGDLLALAVDAARRAAQVHRAGLERDQHTDVKTSTSDPVSDVDRDAERVIVEAIRRGRPDDALLAEESTDEQGSSGVRWVIDPLDGTVNYISRYPLFAVSIGIEVEGVPTIGVVLDSARDRLYAAVAGRGATRDGEAIRVPEPSDLASAIVATGFSYRSSRRAQQAEALRTVLPRIGNIRCDGSAALDLCAVATGEVDAYFENPVAPWDVAAGRVIAEEAGATVSVRTTGTSTDVLAAPPPLFDALQDLLREAGV
ncbi:MAG: inositol monophosphatase family protein [Actinomycetota bacterium]